MSIDKHEWRLCLERELEKVLGEKVKILSISPSSGGCINTSEIVELENGQSYFVKSNREHNLFGAESDGLKAIAATNAIRVPEVVALGTTNEGTHFLILERIISGPPVKDLAGSFGRALALMHSTDSARQVCNKFGIDVVEFGFRTDNHIGSTRQINDWSNDWVTFFSSHRLEYQLDLAIRNGVSTNELERGCKRLMERLVDFLGPKEPSPALLHGDLWSGNFLVSDSGQPVLIDPAVYFGAREAEFGMTKLFGGFNQQFYDAYNEAYPLEEGWEERAEIYQLYHLLNHLNLFGVSYLPGCLEIIRKFN